MAATDSNLHGIIVRNARYTLECRGLKAMRGIQCMNCLHATAICQMRAHAARAHASADLGIERRSRRKHGGHAGTDETSQVPAQKDSTVANMLAMLGTDETSQ